MNQAIARTNTKGQFVIPITMRKHWNINPDTYLQIFDTPNVGIIIKPIKSKSKITDQEYLAILEETQGSWANDDWDQTQNKLDKLAKKELKELKQNAW